MADGIEQDNPLSSARGKINTLADGVRQMTQEVARIADTVFGPQPPQPPSGGVNPSRSGEAGLLHDDMDSLEQSLVSLAAQLLRLKRLGAEQGGQGRPAATTVRPF